MGYNTILEGFLSCDWLTEKGLAGEKADHGLAEGGGE